MTMFHYDEAEAMVVALNTQQQFAAANMLKAAIAALQQSDRQLDAAIDHGTFCESECAKLRTLCGRVFQWLHDQAILPKALHDQLRSAAESTRTNPTESDEQQLRALCGKAEVLVRRLGEYRTLVREEIDVLNELQVATLHPPR